MAIDVIHHRRQPVLPQAPAPDVLEAQFGGLQEIRDEIADLLTDPWFAPLRAGIDAQLARIYRAIRAADRQPLRAAALYNPAERDLAADVWATAEAVELAGGPDLINQVIGEASPPSCCSWHVAGHPSQLLDDDAPAGAGDDVEAYRG